MRRERKKHRKRRLDTLLFSEVNGILLAPEGEACTLHVIRPSRGVDTKSAVRTITTHELAQPIKGFSQRPAPWRTSQSMRQRSDFPEPLCMVFRVGW